jgi:T4 RnlA family RNA ligase
MKIIRPTLRQCEHLVTNNEVFYSKEERVCGQEFKIFNYRLSSFSDFLIPGAVEMRGITFNLTTGEVFPSIHKFFNHNENPFTTDNGDFTTWNYDDKLTITDKRDGSLILPILIDNEVILKTKGTFLSPQALEATKLLEEKYELKLILLDLLKDGYYPLLEYTSPFNQIVIPYEKPELKIIQIRDKNWRYLTYEEIIDLNIPLEYLVEKETKTFEEILEIQKTVKGIEGWVVYNPNEKNLKTAFRKIKTEEYFYLHQIVSPDVLAENKLIELILNEEIDDILANLNEVKKEKVQEINDKVSHYFNYILKECLEIYKKKENAGEENRKEFVMKNKDFKFFGIIMRSKNEDEVEKNLKKYLIKSTNKLLKAREFLEKIEG